MARSVMAVFTVCTADGNVKLNCEKAVARGTVLVDSFCDRKGLVWSDDGVVNQVFRELLGSCVAV